MTSRLLRFLKWTVKWLAVTLICGGAGCFAVFCWEWQLLPFWWLPAFLLTALSVWAFYERTYRRNENGAWALLASGSAATPSLWGCALLLQWTVSALWARSAIDFVAVLFGAMFLLGTTLLTPYALHYSRRCIWWGACTLTTALLLWSGFSFLYLMGTFLDS